MSPLPIPRWILVLAVLLTAALSSLAAQVRPPKVVEADKIAKAKDRLEKALETYCADPQADPELKACLKLATDAIKDRIGGIPQGPKPDGTPRDPLPAVLVDEGAPTDEWAKTKLESSTPNPQPNDPNAISTETTTKVGDKELVVISEGTMKLPDPVLSGILAHEGQRCVQVSSKKIDNKPTNAELKVFWENEKKAYTINEIVQCIVQDELEDTRDSMPGNAAWVTAFQKIINKVQDKRFDNEISIAEACVNVALFTQN